MKAPIDVQSDLLKGALSQVSKSLIAMCSAIVDQDDNEENSGG